MKDIEAFYRAVDNTQSLISDIRQKNRHIIGYLCSYTPEEILYAAGFHPMRLFSSKSEIILAENHLQSYCCSHIRGILEDCLSGRFDFLHGTAFAHTCDSMQRLSDILRIRGKYPFFADLILPSKLNAKSSGIYMENVLLRFKSDLETATGKAITDGALMDSIRLFNRIRRSLSRIYKLHSEKPGILKARDLYSLVKGSMIMDRDVAASRLGIIADELEKTHANVKLNSGKRILLSGSVCNTPDIFDAIENSGGLVIGDDLCTGQRWFEGLISEEAPPISAIAERYLSRIICPAKHSGLTRRAKDLIDLAKKTRAQGVLFLFLKFCDPHAFDYPFLKDSLEKEGIKSMVFEMDEQQQNVMQFLTRIETFVHML